jgi:hypothetical protein
MTLTTSTPFPAVPTFPEARPGSRAARLAMPRAVDALKDLAIDYGVCVRPVCFRRTDLETGQTEVIDLPCGATREDKCPSCAKRAKRERQRQCREGWHRDDEPLPAPDDADDEQRALIALRAHYEFERARCVANADWPQVADLDEAIGEIEQLITETGLRGRVAPAHVTNERGADVPTPPRRVRSTRRRQDTPDLPRKKVQPRTVGAAFGTDDGTIYRPSMFLTLTLDSYGRVRDDGSPVDPTTYDYRRAAWDAVHFPALLDRFFQNLRRAVGWNVQYFGAVEPQRRLAPHAHFAIRGAIPRALLRQVTAATYHQAWWPSTDVIRYPDHHLPEWDEAAGPEHIATVPGGPKCSCGNRHTLGDPIVGTPTGGYVDPDTRTALPTWDEALDAVDANPEAQPVHVARFGAQLDIKGVLGGTPEADKLIGYLTKYLTKSVDACHQADTDRQRAHLDRMWAELRYTPCSPRCPNWLRHGVQPKNAKPGRRPGNCKARVHQQATLGMGGRRVLVSRQWSGKTLADHRADTRAWVRALLGVTVGDDQADTDTPPAPVAWEMARPDDPDIPPLGHRLLRAISARIQQRTELRSARDRAANAPPDGPATAPDDDTRQEGNP